MMRPGSRWMAGATIVLVCACEGSTIDAGDAGDASTNASDGGPTAPPGTLDRGRLGQSCTNSDGCRDGGCYEFGSVEPPIDGGRCVDVSNGCEVLVCSAGYGCIANGGDPSGVACLKTK
jgi:hypothetical protein